MFVLQERETNKNQGIIDALAGLLNGIGQGKKAGNQMQQQQQQMEMRRSAQENQMAMEKLKQLAAMGRINPQILSSPQFKNIMGQMGYGDFDIGETQQPSMSPMEGALAQSSKNGVSQVSPMEATVSGKRLNKYGYDDGLGLGELVGPGQQNRLYQQESPYTVKDGKGTVYQYDLGMKKWKEVYDNDAEAMRTLHKMSLINAAKNDEQPAKGRENEGDDRSQRIKSALSYLNSMNRSGSGEGMTPTSQTTELRDIQGGLKGIQKIDSDNNLVTISPSDTEVENLKLRANRIGYDIEKVETAPPTYDRRNWLGMKREVPEIEIPGQYEYRIVPMQQQMPMQQEPIQQQGSQEVPLLGNLQQGDQQEPITATNPKTGQRVISYDGGMTWQQLR